MTLAANDMSSTTGLLPLEEKKGNGGKKKTRNKNVNCLRFRVKFKKSVDGWLRVQTYFWLPSPLRKLLPRDNSISILTVQNNVKWSK
ncbi:hypothetical protein TNCV_1515421 [Trichonephila clavipes]|nr:hypothetical protein TNCV_1515421 [Trichonephila clavipes]